MRAYIRIWAGGREYSRFIDADKALAIQGAIGTLSAEQRALPLTLAMIEAGPNGPVSYDVFLLLDQHGSFAVEFPRDYSTEHNVDGMVSEIVDMVRLDPGASLHITDPLTEASWDEE